jgi:hypothetical protein
MKKSGLHSACRSLRHRTHVHILAEQALRSHDFLRMSKVPCDEVGDVDDGDGRATEWVDGGEVRII